MNTFSTKIQEVAFVFGFIGVIEWLTIPIAISWTKNPTTLPDAPIRVIASIVAISLPIAGYYLLKSEWKKSNP